MPRWRFRRTLHEARIILVVSLLVMLLVLVAGHRTDRGADGPQLFATATSTSTIVSAAPDRATPIAVVDASRSPANAGGRDLGSGNAVTIAFGGDVHFEGAVARRLAEDPSAPFAMVAPWFEGADLAMVNLETALTERGTPANKKYVFRAPAAAIDALRAGGVDVVSMANNHGLDYGPQGLEDSLATAFYTGYPVLGIGHDEAEAYRPYETTVKGQRLAIIAATQVLDEELIPEWTATADHAGLASAKRVDRLLQAVAEVRARTDTLVVYLHWGTETQTCPNPQQRELAQQLADAGVDIIVGGHAHRVLAAGRLGTSLVGYGLGNFVFFAPDGGASAKGGILTVTVTGRRIDDYQWQPTELHGGLPEPVAGDALGPAIDEWAQLRDCAGLAP